jgi:hypothetical protein
MKGALTVLVLAGLAACSHPDSPEAVDFLIAHPERLRAVTAECRDHREQMNAATCAAAVAAERRRFMGTGSALYTPHTIEAAPAKDARK